MVGGQYVNDVFGYCVGQGFVVVGVFDCWVVFDQIVQLCVIVVVEVQEVDVGFGCDLFVVVVGVDQWIFFEQFQFIGGGDVQYVQVGVVFFCQCYCQF